MDINSDTYSFICELRRYLPLLMHIYTNIGLVHSARLALLACLRVHQDGLVVMAPVCSSWIFMSSPTSGISP